MKPIKLRMQAFSSFAKEVTIDFTKLNQSGFYLITGPTGSGKTTIFDAIMFALYGTASGNVRLTEGFRSDLVDEKTPTFVEFTFEKDNKQYTITRSPRYTVSFRQTPIEPKVSLTYDNKVIEKIGPVALEIERIIGLNADQFRQIIMLAQGEFMKLIHAKSTERDEIFRKIFGTDIFEQVEDKLKEATKELKNIVKLLEEKLKSLLNSLKNYNFENLNASIIDYSHITLLIKEIIEFIKQLKTDLKNKKQSLDTNNNKLLKLVEEKQKAEAINNYFIQLENLEEKLTTFNQNKNKIKTLKEKIEILKKVETIKPIYDQQLLLSSQYLKLQTELKTKQEIFNEKQETINFFIDQTNMIELDRLSLANLKKTKEELVLNLNLKQELNNLIHKQSLLNEQHNEIQNKVNTANKEVEDLNDLIANSEEFINKESTILYEYGNTKNELNELTLRAHNLKEIENLVDKYNDLKKQIKEVTKKYQNAYEKYLDKEKAYQQSEYLYFQNIAQILSKTLVKDMPCPVCGSTNHPNPSDTECELITKEELEQFNNEVELLKKAKDEILINLETLKIEYEKLGTEICDRLIIKTEKDITKAINNCQLSIDNDTDILVKEISIQERTLEAIKTQKDIKEEQLIKLDEAKKDLIIKQDELLEIIKEESILNGQIKSLSSQITIEKKIEEIIEAIDERNIAIEMLEEAIKGFDDEYNLTKEEFNQIKGQLESIIKQYKEVEKNLTKVNKEYESLIKINNISDNIDIYISELTKLSSYIETVTNHQAQIKSINNQITEIKHLLIDKQKIDTTNIENEITNILLENKSLDEDLSIIQTKYSNLTTVSKELERSNKEYLKENNKLLELTELSKVANGQNDKYLSFERYVLIEHFDNILNYANIRLHKMTNGRYVLYRKVDKSKGRSQQGLDMEIFDYETGKKRDVTTLSGGETFKAALSLALGLSDAIETKVGGIGIDTLFIDEGFGTLDEDSLRQAIDILLDLKIDQKTLAVISHVQELKDIIPTRLVVSKDDIGSTIKITE